MQGLFLFCDIFHNEEKKAPDGTLSLVTLIPKATLGVI